MRQLQQEVSREGSHLGQETKIAASRSDKILLPNNQELLPNPAVRFSF